MLEEVEQRSQGKPLGWSGYILVRGPVPEERQADDGLQQQHGLPACMLASDEGVASPGEEGASDSMSVKGEPGRQNGLSGASTAGAARVLQELSKGDRKVILLLAG